MSRTFKISGTLIVNMAPFLYGLPVYVQNVYTQMSSSKKTDLYRNFTAGVYLSEAQNPIHPPPPYTLYTFIQYTYSHREGGRGES